MRCPIEFEAKFKRLSHMRRKLKELLIARLHPSELSLNLCQRLHPSSPFDFMLSLCLPLAFPYSMQWSVANVQHRQIDSYRSVYLSVYLIDCDLCSARLLPDKRLCTASECSLMQVQLAANAGGSRLTKAYTREGERETGLAKESMRKRDRDCSISAEAAGSRGDFPRRPVSLPARMGFWFYG